MAIIKAKYWTIIGSPFRGRKCYMLCNCICVCGTKKTLNYQNVRRGLTNSCGCKNKTRAHNLVGLKFEKLTVISRTKNINNSVAWVCSCDCGSIKTVTTKNLRNGNTKSCGCIKRKSNKTHGMSFTAEYHAYAGMKDRCYNANNGCHKNYGGRGITVCDRWLESFENFYADMGNKPSPSHSIDRINNDGNYCPENCKWSTRSEQALNRRAKSSVRENFGSYTNLTDISRKLGGNHALVSNRIRAGWPHEKAVTVKVK